MQRVCIADVTLPPDKRQRSRPFGKKQVNGKRSRNRFALQKKELAEERMPAFALTKNSVYK